MTKEVKKPGKDVVYLDIDDDITTIVDKVEGSKDKIVALVLPKRFATLQSIVNMRLLKRSADSAAKNVVLITSEAALLPLAGAAGIHVAKNLQSKPEIPPSPVDLPQEKPTVPEDPDVEIDAKDAKLDYHRSIGGLAAAGAVEEPETIPLEDEEEEKESVAHPKKPRRDKKLRIPNFERFRLLLALGAIGVISLITFLILAIFVWPKATITLQTEATPLSAVFELTTSDKATTLDEEKDIIPAVLKTSDLKSNQKVKATGQQNNGNKATGSVTMTGKACAPNLGNIPADVPAGTGVSTGGVYFITQQKASFSFDYPDGSCNYYKTNSVSITAQAAGIKYNVSNASFTVTNRSDISATGSASGGTDDIETVLSQADVNGATNKITDEDRNKFVDSFKKSLGEEGFYIIEATLKAKDPAVTTSPAVGEAASEANVSIKISYSVLVVPKEELKKAITAELEKQIDKNKQKIGTDDVLQAVTVSVRSQKSSTVATLSINADTTAVAIIDTDSIKTQVGGKKTSEIKSLLGELPGVKNVEVHMSPFWVSKAPKAGKITVIQEQIKTESSGS
ncbi:MAG TPA: hypothetical protein VI336_03230 [Candidatus Saccharimonadales bacterium]|nr:hypothetical protein [Candidatus Saccharimonadales bacterium]